MPSAAVPRVVRPARAAAVAAEAAQAPDARAAAARVMQVLPGVMDAMRHAMRDQLGGAQAAPLTVPQFRGLNFIDREPGTSISALAAFLGVTLATASAMVDRLVRAGYLQSQGSRTDRRRAELQLLASGKQVLERIRGQTRDDLARALQCRSPQELAALVDGLRVLDTAFARPGAPLAPAAAGPAARSAR